MKNIIILVVLVIFASCGDNPVNNGNNPPPVTDPDSLIISLDSLSIYGAGQLDSLINDLSNFNNDSLKVTFTSVTNCGVNDTLVVNTSIGAYHYLILSSAELNTNHVYRFDNSSPYSFRIVLWNYSSNKYLKLKNIKLYKIKT